MRIEASPTGFSLTAIDERGRLLICGQTFWEGNEYANRFVEVPQLPPVTRAAAGADRCAAVTADGRLYRWGETDNADDVLTEIGRGEAGRTRMTGLSCGYGFAAACGEDGRVYVWGRLPGTETLGDEPVRAEGIDDAQAVACGCRHIGVLHRDGTVSAWESGGDGRLGTGRFGDEPQPCRVVSPDGSGLLTGVVSLAAGAGHTAAVDGDGRLFVWGRNVGGVFGSGYRFGCESAVPLPVDVSLFGSRSVRKVYGGHDCLHVLLSDGSLCSWGLETSGEFGCGAAVPRITDVPQKAELTD